MQQCNVYFPAIGTVPLTIQSGSISAILLSKETASDNENIFQIYSRTKDETDAN